MLLLVDKAKISSKGRETEIYIQRRKASNEVFKVLKLKKDSFLIFKDFFDEE